MCVADAGGLDWVNVAVLRGGSYTLCAFLVAHDMDSGFVRPCLEEIIDLRMMSWSWSWSKRRGPSGIR